MLYLHIGRLGQWWLFDWRTDAFQCQLKLHLAPKSRLSKRGNLVFFHAQVRKIWIFLSCLTSESNIQQHSNCSINLKVCLSSTPVSESLVMTPRWIWCTLFFFKGAVMWDNGCVCRVRLLFCFALLCCWSKVAYLMPLQLGYNWVFLQARLLFWYLQLHMLAKSGCYLGERDCVLLFFNEQRVKLIRSDDFDKEKKYWYWTKWMEAARDDPIRGTFWLLNIKLQKCLSNVPTPSALTCNCHQQKWSSRSCHLAVRCQCPYGVEETPQ